MKTVAVYYMENKGLSTRIALNNMKDKVKNENWIIRGVFIDKMNEYEALMHVLTNEFSKIDILYIYTLDSIKDDFYWDILLESTRVDSVQIIEYK
ncbi:hypothetical protein DYI25_05260 [Mesobacillus boroniphilus]|uniref:Uncharacterized protein n=1 Tax=Mesobacillus boroniphilus TaxID=308892 RepID=A0A944CJL3_9BACI|nr:hypothetical protein [Mesobacillus boroniphilus]MBS8263847.1 hypothetical protein [Mesobacillus boroniphilus]